MSDIQTNSNFVSLKTRYSFKHDTEENWKKATNFKPLIYEPIMYDPDDTHPEVRYKLGDGINYINDLPFCSAPIVAGIGDNSISQASSASEGNYGSAFGNNTLTKSESGFTTGYKTVVSPCSRYIKDDLVITHPENNGEHEFTIDYVGEVQALPALISYRYYSTEQSKYLYFNEQVEEFPINVQTEDTIAIRSSKEVQATISEFYPGSSEEGNYLDLVPGGNGKCTGGSTLHTATTGAWALRYADGNAYFIYKYENLTNIPWDQVKYLTWSAKVAGQLKVEYTTDTPSDNASWTTLYDHGNSSKLSIREMSFRIDVSDVNNLYIKVSDSDTSNNNGGAVSKEFPVTLSYTYEKFEYKSDVLFGGKLSAGEEMFDTDTADSLLAPSASGFVTYALGKGAHAGGYLSTAYKPASFAHGYKAIALGDAAAAFGADVLVKDDRGFAAGHCLVSAGHAQAVFGRYNEENKSDVLIVGWGESKSKPKNIFTLSKEGNGTFTGNINAYGNIISNNLNVNNTITIGSTTLTEAQVKKLIDFLDTIE